MNKKGEAITLSIFALLILMGAIFIYQGAVDKNDFVGDKSTKIAYNLQSLEENCNLAEIKIASENLVFFEDLNEVNKYGYNLSSECN